MDHPDGCAPLEIADLDMSHQSSHEAQTGVLGLVVGTSTTGIGHFDRERLGAEARRDLQRYARAPDGARRGLVRRQNDGAAVEIVNVAPLRQLSTELSETRRRARKGGVKVVHLDRLRGSRNHPDETQAARRACSRSESGHVNSTRIGRRSHYTINRGVTMRHPAQRDYEIGELLDLLTLTDSSDKR